MFDYRRMTKKEFLIQYVLNRADTVDDLDPLASAKRAEEAWNYIQTSCKEDK